MTLAPTAGATLTALVLLAVAIGPSQARPRRDEPPAKAGACDRFGAGYRQVAGTDTCLRVSGNVRVETGLVLSGGGDHDVGSFLGRPRR